jgi:hypothetical protein
MCKIARVWSSGRISPIMGDGASSILATRCSYGSLVFEKLAAIARTIVFILYKLDVDNQSVCCMFPSRRLTVRCSAAVPKACHYSDACGRPSGLSKCGLVAAKAVSL